jgi:hypothetical protein
MMSYSCSPACSMVHSRSASDMVSPYRRSALRHSGIDYDSLQPAPTSTVRGWERLRVVLA